MTVKGTIKQHPDQRQPQLIYLEVEMPELEKINQTLETIHEQLKKLFTVVYSASMSMGRR